MAGVNTEHPLLSLSPTKLLLLTFQDEQEIDRTGRIRIYRLCTIIQGILDGTTRTNQ